MTQTQSAYYASLLAASVSAFRSALARSTTIDKLRIIPKSRTMYIVLKSKAKEVSKWKV